MARGKLALCAAVLLAGAAVFATSPALANDGDGDSDDHGVTSCHLSNGIKYIVELQFDNVHFRRDNPNVPSDLEQIPNLLNFLEDNGTVLTNHFTPLISHTSVDIVTTLTGVYGGHMGLPIGNTILYFLPNGSTQFASSFAYWTDTMGANTANPEVPTTPQMVDQRGKVHPAPWVPFTRAGCNVGAFSVANIELENTGTNAGGDIASAFGASSPQATEVNTLLALPSSDSSKKSINAQVRAVPAAEYEGIAIHCAKGSPLCANGQNDVLNDEPGGYVGFKALFGNKFVAAAINSGHTQSLNLPELDKNDNVTGTFAAQEPFVSDLDGNAITDSFGTPGLPTGFDPAPAQTLGYAAQMLENGVQVVYLYIEDAHDNHNFPGAPANPDGTFGPGEAGYVFQLKAYNDAFGKFFARLARDGITKDNTLFIITADENDHFAGGPASPANCDGVNVSCTYALKGEVDANEFSLFSFEFNQNTTFDSDFDDAPAIYINNEQGQQSDTITRQFENQAAKLTGFNPILDGQGLPAVQLIAQRLADAAEMRALHMITSDPLRTPNFILFGNPDYFLDSSPSCTNAGPPFKSCFSENRSFAWNHGDFQDQITNTWLGLVGPGVKNEGATGFIFSDHTDTRPTLIALTGLKDDYQHDGRVLIEILKDGALPDSLNDHEGTLSRLGQAYKQINAPKGEFGRKTLNLSTIGVGGSDATHTIIDGIISGLTDQRNAIASQMIDMLEDAAFNNQTIDENEAQHLIKQADDLLDSIK